MIKVTKNLLRLGKAVAVGTVIGQLQRKIATRFRGGEEDPLYHHWYLALDALLQASRINFDSAAAALLKELDDVQKSPVKPSFFKDKNQPTNPLN